MSLMDHKCTRGIPNRNGTRVRLYAYYLLVLRFWERAIVAIIGMTRFWILRIIFRMGSAIIKRLGVRDRFTGWLLIIDSCSPGSSGGFQCICAAKDTHAFKSHNDIRRYFWRRSVVIGGDHGPDNATGGDYTLAWNQALLKLNDLALTLALLASDQDTREKEKDKDYCKKD